MDLPDNVERKSVLTAIIELEHGAVEHGFDESTKFDILHEGRRYPPKAIIALATKAETGQLPTPSDFSGGVGSKCFRLLRDAGFRVVPKRNLVPFKVGSSYTRKKIGEYLGTSEDTTKGDWATGYHFHADAEAGILGWWFIFASVGSEGSTGHDYGNQWISDTHLEWEGKTSSKLGQPQIESILSGNAPVLLFTRDEKRAPFVYHGLAQATKVEDTSPVRVVWEASAAVVFSPSADDDAKTNDSFEPKEGDYRQQALRLIKVRQGQQGFREQLLRAYKGQCVISGCTVERVLEAAHISAYRGIHDHHIQNGMLLRADFHTLFDLDLLAIEPNSLEVRIHPAAMSAPYSDLHGQKIEVEHKLSYQALMERWQVFVEGGGK